jgi:YesN/AraC family two-component response regulator
VNRYLKNRTFIKIFAVCFLCLLLITCLLCSCFFIRERTAQRAEQEKECLRVTDNVVLFLEEMIRREHLLAAQLRTSWWVAQRSSQSDVFEERFTPQELQEIGEQWIFNTTLNPDVLFRAVYFTDKCSVIHASGENSGEYFFTIRGVPDDQIENFLQMLSEATIPQQLSYSAANGGKCFGGNILLLNPVYGIEGSPAYLLTMLNVSVLKEQLQRILPASFAGLEIEDGENKILEIQRKDKNYTQTLAGYSIPLVNWKVTFHVDGVVKRLSNNLLFWNVLLIVAAMSIVFPVALMLASLFYTRLSRLSRALPMEEKSQDMYSDIEKNISRLVQVQENVKRERFLQQLLMGSLQQTDIAFLPKDYRNRYVQVYLLFNEEDLSTANTVAQQVLKELENLHGEFLQGYDGVLIMVVFARYKSELSRLNSRLEEKFPDAPQKFVAGPILLGYGGITHSFQEALKKRRYRYFCELPRYYLPLEIEHYLVLAMRNGRLRETTDALKQLLDENEQRMKWGKMSESDLIQLSTVLMNDLVRIVLEKNLSPETLTILESMDFSSVYDVFSKMNESALEICAQCSERKTNVNSTALEIVKYIDDNYADSSLSIVALQEVFHLSANTLNKNIKAAVGTTFLPYLTYVRMEKAKRLLSAEDAKISEIYKQVGYDVEFSFRRAFMRYSGYGAQSLITQEEPDSKAEQ